MDAAATAADQIAAYLAQHEQKSLLRFITCGSVDDGKSTLIGRLLHDCQQLFDDQMAALERDSRKHGTQGDAIDFALLVDGLSAEREQGITIDVAYRYFSTEKRKFIVADCPGHEQYTRNMATGASTADLAIVLIDARKGVLTQSRRHSYIIALLGVRQVILAVNKMDLVDYRQDVFDAIVADYRQLAEHLGITKVDCVPMSALTGDQVTRALGTMPWYPAARHCSSCWNGPTSPAMTPSAAFACRCSGSTARIRAFAATPEPSPQAWSPPAWPSPPCPPDSNQLWRASSAPMAISIAPAPGRRSR